MTTTKHPVDSATRECCGAIGTHAPTWIEAHQ